MIFDIHCHIDLYENPQKIIMDSTKHNIYILSVTTTPKAWEITNKICSTNSRIKTALGFHPQIASERYDEIGLFDELLPKTKYVGEIGLDGGSEFRETFDKQLSIFRHILEKIKESGGKIMSIHSRNAAAIVLEELKLSDGIPILHWFSGSKIELDKAIQQGCWFSVGLPMVSSKKGQQIISSIPKERLLTETDAPFNKYNNNILMPWDVELIFPGLSRIWNVSVNDARETVFSNLKTLLTTR